jgi:hypothetical protein
MAAARARRSAVFLAAAEARPPEMYQLRADAARPGRGVSSFYRIAFPRTALPLAKRSLAQLLRQRSVGSRKPSTLCAERSPGRLFTPNLLHPGQHRSDQRGRHAPNESVTQPQAGIFAHFYWPLYEGGGCIISWRRRNPARWRGDAAQVARDQALREVALAYDQIGTACCVSCFSCCRCCRPCPHLRIKQPPRSPRPTSGA